MGDDSKERLTAARHLVGGLYHYQSRYGGDVLMANWHLNDVKFAARTLADAHAAGEAKAYAEVRAMVEGVVSELDAVSGMVHVERNARDAVGRALDHILVWSKGALSQLPGDGKPGDGS